MEKTQSFADIFAAKIESKIRQEYSQESFDLSRDLGRAAGQEFDTSPAHLAFLMSQVQPLKSTAAHKAYKAGPRPAPKPHLLNATQNAAAAVFARFGAELSPAFRPNELKKAFRTLAKKLHPDHSGGGAQDFIQLKMAFDCLQKIN